MVEDIFEPCHYLLQYRIQSTQFIISELTRMMSVGTQILYGIVD